MKNMPSRIVLDTNCLISAFLSGSYSSEIVSLASRKKIKLITTKSLNADLSEVFHKKVSRGQLKINHYLNKIHAISEVVSPTQTIQVVDRDIDDNKVLEAAVEGGCKYIVTGDKDLLELKNYQGIKILAPKDFINEFKEVLT